MQDDFIWVEKYRPKTIAETILPKALKAELQSIVDTGEIPNMTFSGTAGLGKTTAAKAICNELGVDYIVISGSENGNIDTLRTKIRQFASTVSLSGGYKVVIIDEADGLNPQSFQPALRTFTEEFAKNCRFILTCNFKNRIIEPLHSRCPIYEFNTSRKAMASLAGQFMQRLEDILTKENVTYTKSDLAELIMKHTPDWRRCLNEAQRRSMSGMFIPSDGNSNATQFNELVSHLKAKDFKKMRNWVVNNIDTDAAAIFRGIYDIMNDKVVPGSIPQLVLILADYQYKNAFVADHELNVVACMTEIMANVDFT